MWRVSAAALVCVTWLAAARPVCAQNVPRVSLVPLSGALQAEVQRDVVAALALHSSDIEFVSVTTFSATLGNSHSAHDDTDTLNAARALHLDAIVDGGVFRGASRRHVLRLRVRSVADGSILGSGAWAFRRGTEVRGLRGDIWDQLHDALTGSVHAATPPPHQTEPAAEDPPPASPAAAAPARSVEPEPAHESTPQPTPSGIEPPSAPLHTGVAPTPGLGIVWAQLLGGVGMRSWSVPVLGDIAPRGYENQGYPEGGAEIMALYRFDDERAGVGVSAGGAIPVSISSSGVDANGNMVSVPTQAFEVWGGVAAAYRPPGGGLMRVQIGAFMHSFSLDTSMLPPSQQLASIAYLGGRVAAEGVLPLYVDRSYELGLLFGAELRVAQVGGGAPSAFGMFPSPAIGIGGMAGLALRLDALVPGLAVRAFAELLRYRVQFSGPSTIGTVSDSVDDYVRFCVAVVMAFGTHRVN